MTMRRDRSGGEPDASTCTFPDTLKAGWSTSDTPEMSSPLTVTSATAQCVVVSDANPNVPPVPGRGAASVRAVSGITGRDAGEREVRVVADLGTLRRPFPGDVISVRSRHLNEQMVPIDAVREDNGALDCDRGNQRQLEVDTGSFLARAQPDRRGLRSGERPRVVDRRVGRSPRAKSVPRVAIPEASASACLMSASVNRTRSWSQGSLISCIAVTTYSPASSPQIRY